MTVYDTTATTTYVGQCNNVVVNRRDVDSRHQCRCNKLHSTTAMSRGYHNNDSLWRHTTAVNDRRWRLVIRLTSTVDNVVASLSTSQRWRESTHTDVTMTTCRPRWCRRRGGRLARRPWRLAAWFYIARFVTWRHQCALLHLLHQWRDAGTANGHIHTI